MLSVCCTSLSAAVRPFPCTALPTSFSLHKPRCCCCNFSACPRLLLQQPLTTCSPFTPTLPLVCCLFASSALPQTRFALPGAALVGPSRHCAAACTACPRCTVLPTACLLHHPRCRPFPLLAPAWLKSSLCRASALPPPPLQSLSLLAPLCPQAVSLPSLLIPSSPCRTAPPHALRSFSCD